MTPATAHALDERYDRISLDVIDPSKIQPRTIFPPDYLEQLKVSVEEKGVLEPILLRPRPQGRYEIVSGECRTRAAKLAGLTEIPAVVRSYTDEQVLEIQLEENIHRKNLTPLEEAVAYRRLIATNPDKHSAASIATRIGMSVTYVWDYLKLNDLIPAAKELLAREKMAVGHAIIIARQKAADQARIIAPNARMLFVPLARGLEFDGDTDPKEKPGKYDDVKAVTVRELEAAIAHHIRFDIAHAAKAVPLEFEAAAAKVEEAAAAPGRGKKVIAITFAHGASDDAKDPNERTYGRPSWRLADGSKKSQPDGYGRPMKDSPTCDLSVLGVVVAGDEHYGETFQVCISRDKCKVHFGKEIAEREKNQKLRDSGKGKQADKREEKTEDRDKKRHREEQQREENDRRVWTASLSDLDAAALEVVKKLPIRKVIERLVRRSAMKRSLTALCGKRQPRTADEALRVLVLNDLTDGLQNSYRYDRELNTKGLRSLGIDVKAILSKHQPKPAAAPAKKGAAA